MVVRRAVLALRHFHLLPPRLLPTRRLLLPRRLLPSLVKARTTPTTPLLGRPANASTLYQCQVDVPPTRPCWPVARERTVDRHPTFASRRYPIHPLPHPPPHPRRPTQCGIPTTHWLGRRANASRRSRCQVVGRPMPARRHVVRRRMLDSRVGLAWFDGWGLPTY